MVQKTKVPTDGQKIATLIRILRGAVAAGDKVLMNAVAAELKEYGIVTADWLFKQEAQNDAS
ncbi:hypothetical protein EC9_51560 [Rosistilla ulvae]|uniref:Uncharacterized protein n=1 Tax=Rosistilla ulvae TaxID=1930277 RepID=A0A517M7T3_9BACT|nr:hypothetical protein [Rosistilla ulvae]QDS90938.1 hypothetical protein EC9_51560 [Rosistilla ulvae]